MAVSTDGGKTFTDHVVHTGSPSISYGHQFVNLSIDRAGNLYSVYSDDHNIYYSFSQDHGTTWSGPYKINTGAAGQQTAIMPWSVAGDSGRIDVVYYGADYYAPGTSPDSYPCNDSNHCASVTPNGTPTAHWNVYLAENISALAGGTSWSTTQVTGYPVHYGGVCEGGISCTGDRSANRDLYDDFGIAVSPVNNAAAIIYSDDRYSEYNHTSRCTPAQDNTGVCDHTNIATGVSSIFTTGTGGNGGGAGNGGGGPGGGDGGAGAGWGDNGGHGGEGQQTSDTTSGGADRMSGPR